ncbi:MAG: hypothetical protein H0T69_02555, partial [Thermoleophilaceae bacterium]|nr:hypothetical protein [Thermoleophilaceae bacterium]
VSPAYGGRQGLELARSGPVLQRAVALAGRRGRSAGWLREHSKVQLTSRLDFAIGVEAPESAEAVSLATAYAKAIKRSMRIEPGLGTIGRRSRGAQRELGPLGWAMLGGAAGLWLGAAAAIVRSGSGPAPRRASPPCARATRATPG